MPSVGDPDWHNSNSRPVRISLAPHAVLLMHLRGHTGHEKHPRGFTALPVKADLAIKSQRHGVSDSA